MSHTTFDRRPGPTSVKIARVLHRAKIANTHEVATLMHGENPSAAQIKTTWDALNTLRKKRFVEYEHGQRRGPGYGSDAMVWWLSPVGLTYVHHGWFIARRQLQNIVRTQGIIPL